jgi:hypothetical protein
MTHSVAFQSRTGHGLEPEMCAVPTWGDRVPPFLAVLAGTWPANGRLIATSLRGPRHLLVAFERLSGGGNQR